jgi:hypothetical protein
MPSTDKHLDVSAMCKGTWSVLSGSSSDSGYLNSTRTSSNLSETTIAGVALYRKELSGTHFIHTTDLIETKRARGFTHQRNMGNVVRNLFGEELHASACHFIKLVCPRIERSSGFFLLSENITDHFGAPPNDPSILTTGQLVSVR